MSFLVDPPLLYAAGEAYARALPESAQGRSAGAAGALTVGVFVGAGVAAWLETDAARRLVRPFGSRSGREFMVAWPAVAWRGGKRAGRREHALAAAAFALYPLWWRLGWDHGRRARP